MRNANAATCILVAMLATFSCTTQQDETTADNHPTPIYRGHAVHGHEVRSFRPCGSNDELWVLDSNDLLWPVYQDLELPAAPYPEVFVVIKGRRVPAPDDGFGADYSGAIEIEDVLYAGVEGPGCDTNWRAFQFRAHGNEPFWMIAVMDGRMRMSQPGSEDRLWHDVIVSRADDRIRFTCSDTTSSPAELTIARAPCHDSMSGAYFAYSAVFLVGNEEYRGCALQAQP